MLRFNGPALKAVMAESLATDKPVMLIKGSGVYLAVEGGETSDDGQIVHKAYATGCHPFSDPEWRSMGDILITGKGNNVTRFFLTDGQRWDIATKSFQLVAFQEDEFPKVFTGHREYVPVATYREYTKKLNALAEQFDSSSRQWSRRTWREMAYSLIWEYHMSDCKRASCDEHNLFVLALNKLHRRAQKLSLSGERVQG